MRLNILHSSTQSTGPPEPRTYSRGPAHLADVPSNEYVEVAEGMMAKSRSAFSQAVVEGPFAAIYWATFGLAAIAVVAGIFGSQEQRIVTGAIVVVVVVTLGIARYVIASRVDKQRTTGRST